MLRTKGEVDGLLPWVVCLFEARNRWLIQRRDITSAVRVTESCVLMLERMVDGRAGETCDAMRQTMAGVHSLSRCLNG